MSTVTTNRRIDIGGVADVTARWDGERTEVEDLRSPPRARAALQSEVDAAPLAGEREAADEAERARVRIPAGLRTKVKANAADPANATAYTAVEQTRLLTWLAVEHRDGIT